MNIKKMAFAFVGAALLTMGAFADDPSIKLERFQQRYPWNGLVDIDFTVANVSNPEDYYVKFTVTHEGATTGIVATDFLDASKLAMAVNGTHRVTWDTEFEKAFIFSTNVTIRADLIYDPSCKGDRTPYVRYLEIDLSQGSSAASFPVTTAFIGTRAANAKYNVDEYKKTKLALRKINAGTFTMGSPDGTNGTVKEDGREKESWMNKETQHPVTLTKGFYFGVFPVTQKQWQMVMGANPSRFTGNSDAETCPVETVSYEMIRTSSTGATPDEPSFVDVLRAKTGLTGLDLPTEAQWEYATRAGTTESTYFGNNVAENADLLKAHVWYSGNAGSTTHGVGQFPSNPWGLYDTLGNVWECCRDSVTAGPSHDLGSAAVTDPITMIENGTFFTLRGGCWINDGAAIRCACRSGDVAVAQKGTKSAAVGFRLSCPLP